MSKNHVSARTVTITIVALCALFAAGAYTLGVMNMKSEVPEEAKAENTAGSKEPGVETGLLAVTPEDVIIGDAQAPVTIVEYASLSCSHCAHFHNEELPKLTKDYLDTGKARLVLRQFPLNAPALKGALLVGCVPAEEKRKFIKVLFEMQSQWAMTQSYLDELKKIAAVGGISGEKFNSCVNDKAAEEALIAKTQEASDKLAINGTPAFFVDNKIYTGSFDAEGLGAAVDAAKTK